MTITVQTPEQQLPLTAPREARVFGSFQEIAGFIWSIADLLRGPYKAHEYGEVILPMTVLRRLDCVLEGTRAKVLARLDELKADGFDEDAPENAAVLESVLNDETGMHFHNRSRLDFNALLGDTANLPANLKRYVKDFSLHARDVMKCFNFDAQVDRLAKEGLLFLVVKRFAEVDLHDGDDRVDTIMMGSIFEELIRRFSETYAEDAGAHFTPREVIKLMVALLLAEDREAVTRAGASMRVFDPACGTGGMLSVAQAEVLALNGKAEVKLYGQELNQSTYAICKADMMLKGQNPEQIKQGDSFTKDGHAGETFEYMLSNPPFGVDWSKSKEVIEAESKKPGGRFGAGLPRVSDGSLLFLQHMLSKRRGAAARDRGTRIAIVFNGSPLFTGDAGSGESNIRRWILENDWLDAVVALPDQLFHNTGISTYVWVLAEQKPAHRRGRVLLVNAVGLFKKMRRSLGQKRNELSEEHVAEIVRLYHAFEPGPLTKVFDTEDFGYRRIVVERPLRLNFQASPERIARLDEQTAFRNLTERKNLTAAKKEEGVALQTALRFALGSLDAVKVHTSWKTFEPALDGALKGAKVKLAAPLREAVLWALGERDDGAEIHRDEEGNPVPDPDLRDNENVPLKEDIDVYFDREVKPHVPDAWIDRDPKKIVVGYEIPFTRHFYGYEPLRPLGKINSELRSLEGEIQALLGELT